MVPPRPAQPHDEALARECASCNGRVDAWSPTLPGDAHPRYLVRALSLLHTLATRCVHGQHVPRARGRPRVSTLPRLCARPRMRRRSTVMVTSPSPWTSFLYELPDLFHRLPRLVCREDGVLLGGGEMWRHGDVQGRNRRRWLANGRFGHSTNHVYKLVHSGVCEKKSRPALRRGQPPSDPSL